VSDVEVAVEGRVVRLSSLDRVLWPAAGVTKADLVDYYARVAPVLLPHLAGRPLTLHRFPEGVGGPHFFQTRTPPHPDWVSTQRMWTFTSGKQVDAPVVGDLPSLLWAANLSTIELHPFLSTGAALDRPTMLVLDLDPGEPAGLVEACRVALDVRDLLAGIGLASLAKVSGRKGLHVQVPLAPGHTYDETKAVARALAGALARVQPDRVVDRMAKGLRRGRVFVDWSQNDAGKSTVAPYSLRAGTVPTVALPVTWEEVHTAVATGDAAGLVFGPGDALARVEELGDLFAPLLAGDQRLTVPRGARVERP
jgi:bifunctional non-homologous end joining protein LigD